METQNNRNSVVLSSEVLRTVTRWPDVVSAVNEARVWALRNKYRMSSLTISPQLKTVVVCFLEDAKKKELHHVPFLIESKDDFTPEEVEYLNRVKNDEVASPRKLVNKK